MSSMQIAAIIAAAGLSTRMGTPKQLLPWGERTILATVVDTLSAAGAAPVICVVGHRAPEILATLAGTDAIPVTNHDYERGEMLSSLQTGIRFLLDHDLNVDDGSTPTIAGTLISLGDQPHIPVQTVRSILKQARRNPEKIVIPSHQMRRGHPFFLPRALWWDLLDLDQASSLRLLVNQHKESIVYVNVDHDAILRDIDTPEDYQNIARRRLD